jgi:hypothetical protein
MLHYTTTLHPDLSFLLKERRTKSLHQMFNDAQGIQHNIQACKKLQKEGLDAQEHESECEQKIVDLSLEHRIDNIMGALKVSNAYDCDKNYIPLVKRRGVVLASEPSHDKKGDDYFIYSSVDSQEYEFAN